MGIQHMHTYGGKLNTQNLVANKQKSFTGISHPRILLNFASIALKYTTIHKVVAMVV